MSGMASAADRSLKAPLPIDPISTGPRDLVLTQLEIEANLSELGLEPLTVEEAEALVAEELADSAIALQALTDHLEPEILERFNTDRADNDQEPLRVEDFAVNPTLCFPVHNRSLMSRDEARTCDGLSQTVQEATLDLDIAEARLEVATLEASIADREASIADLQAENAELAAEEADLDKRLSEQQKTIAELDAINAELKETNKAYERILEALKAAHQQIEGQ